MSEREPDPGTGSFAADDDVRARRLAALLAVDIGDIATARGASISAPIAPGDAPMPVAEAEVEAPGETPPDGTAQGRSDTGPRAHRVGWRTVAAFVVLAGLLSTGVGLAYAGSRIVRSSTRGEVVAPIADPSAPGYEAVVDPTPTLLLLHENGGLIDSLTVLSLPDPEGTGGGVLFVPTRTALELPIYGVAPVEIAYDLGDARIEAEAVANLLDTALGETAVVDAARWADLVAPVAPITIDNPNELEVDGDVRFPLGEIRLEADDVGPYLEASAEGESDLARLFRQQLFWEAWLDAVAQAGTVDAVPGELESGIGRFVRAIASGEAVLTTLPVQPAAPERFGPEPAFLPLDDEIESLLGRIIPFPVSPSPGARARVRVLNGTTDTDEAASIAADLTPAGVQIVIIGNASSFGSDRTTVSYFGEQFRDEAAALTEILGVGEVVEETRPSDAVDITVTLGADYE